MFNVNDIRKDFDMFKNNPNLIYFDNAATTFKPNIVVDAINNYYRYNTTNIHRGDYNLSIKVSDQYESTRKTIKKFINCLDEKEIIFTSGASQALNMIAYGYQEYINEEDIILTTKAEHASNLLPWFKIAQNKKAIIKYINLDNNGILDMNHYKSLLNDKVKVISLAYITNVLGHIVPIKEITKLAHQYNAIVICDAAQAIPHKKIDVLDLDIDFLIFSAHKMCGPTGVGVIYGKYQLLDSIQPYNLGGGSNITFDNCGNISLKKPPHKFESGTPNIAGVLGLNASINYLMNIGMDNIEKYEKQLYQYLINQLNDIENIVIYNKGCQSSILTFNIKDIFPQDVGAYLNKYNIATRSGNHCAKILNDILNTQYTNRLSLYFYNTKEEIDYFIKIIKDITLEKCIDIII